MDRDRLLWILLAIIGVGAVVLMFNNDSGQSFGIENNDFASFIYLGAFGLVIGAALFRRSLPTGQMFRLGAVWVCVILALMVVYQVLATYGLLPENFAPRLVPNSGAGITASLMDGVHAILHL